MEPLTVAITGLALAVLAHGVMWFFKTPKESSNEMAARISEQEKQHHELERGFIKSHVYLGAKVEALAVNIKELNDTMKQVVQRMDRANVGT